MSFLQREYEKLMTVCQNTKDGPGYDAAYLAKQVLAWSLDPDTVSSPSAYLAKFYGVSVPGTTGTGVAFEGAVPEQPKPISDYDGLGRCGNCGKVHSPNTDC